MFVIDNCCIEMTTAFLIPTMIRPSAAIGKGMSLPNDLEDCYMFPLLNGAILLDLSPLRALDNESQMRCNLGSRVHKTQMGPPERFPPSTGAKIWRTTSRNPDLFEGHMREN